MFIDNQANLGDNLINIVLEGSLMISIGYDNYISTICNMYTAYNPNITKITSMTTLKTYLTNPNYVNKQVTFSPNNQSKKWFNVRCGYNLDNKYFYTMMTVKDNTAPVVQQMNSVHNPRYYDGIDLDFHFRYFWKPNMNININNSSSAGITTAIYMRNLQLFSELIPKSSGINYL